MQTRFPKLFVLLVASLVFSRVCAAADQTPQDKFATAVALLNAKKLAEAFPIFDDLSKTYPTPSVFWNLGITAAEVGNNKEALRAWLSYRETNPTNWQVRAKLVQTYQALGDLAARDKERADLMASWRAGTDAQLSAQPHYFREQFQQDGRKVMVLEYFNPSGPKLIVYSFVVLDKTGQPDFKISLGSYDLTNQVALELGERPKDKRMYHLDLYRSNSHETHGMYLGQPGYDQIRPVVVDVLSGKRKAASSSATPPPTTAQ
ncbi:MAG: hypothetical protein V4723_21155 [Pseudomonadota bacterium]